MFGCVVDWSCEGRDLACYAGDVYDGFGGRRGCRVLFLHSKEVGEGELRGADWMREIDVEDCVAVVGWGVGGGWGAGWVPEVGEGLG